MKRLEPILLPLALGALVLFVWWWGVRWSGTKIFPSPAQVVQGLGELSRRGVLLPYMRDSLLRVAVGYSAAVLIGVPLGMWMGWSKDASTALNPVIQFLRPIS